MKREDVLKMEAGREMDALIAEKVMGWEWWHFNKRSHLSAHESEPFYLEAGWIKGRDDNTPITDTSNCPHYSTDIAAAWQVHKKLCNEMSYSNVNYYGELQHSVGLRYGGSHPAYPYLLAFLEPIDFCRATLLTTMDLS